MKARAFGMTSGSSPGSSPAPSTAAPESDGDGKGASIVLADDHAIVRGAVRRLLEAAGFEIAAEAGDVAETLRKVRGYKPDVLLLDLSMPGGSSLGAIPTLLEASPGTAIVILTMHNRAGFAHEALRAGACGFVRKEAADSELVDAVRAALVGDLYVDPRLGASMAVEREDAPPSPN